MKNNYWTFKKQNFKADGLVVYAGYLFDEFQGYFHKEKNYRLIEKSTQKGIERKEKFIGYGQQIFLRSKEQSWSEWVEYHKNFVNEIV